MAVVAQYVQWAGKAGRRMPRLLCYWLMLVVNSLKCNSWMINLANLGRHAQLTRCFSAVAELLPQRNSASAAHVYLGWLTDCQRCCKYQSHKYKYKYKYLTLKYKYKYFKMVLKYYSSTSTNEALA